MRAYVINLPRSAERREHMTAELAKARLEYQVIEGVDGRDLDLSDPDAIDPSVRGRIWFRPGVAGCAMSHLRAYQQIIADGLDRALVLEDDVTLPADLGSLLAALAEHLTGAEVALLNYDSEHPCQMSRVGAIRLPGSRLLALPIDVRQPVSGAGYLITRDGCERLVKGGLPMRARADDWGMFFAAGMLDRVRCVVPIAISKDPGFGSTIDYRPQTSVRVRLRELVVRYRLPVLHQVLAYRRRRIFRQWTKMEFVDAPFIEKPSRLD